MRLIDVMSLVKTGNLMKNSRSEWREWTISDPGMLADEIEQWIFIKHHTSQMIGK